MLQDKCGRDLFWWGSKAARRFLGLPDFSLVGLRPFRAPEVQSPGRAEGSAPNAVAANGGDEGSCQRPSLKGNAMQVFGGKVFDPRVFSHCLVLL